MWKHGQMSMNFMDYSADRCMCMFTVSQVTRMQAALSHPSRVALLSSDGLIPAPTDTMPIGADLWSQDTPEDTGSEPDNASTILWVSDDIWVRSERNDGRMTQDHENPQYRPPASDRPNYVYVRVRNRGCQASGSATVKLYWAKASTALGWPSPWDGTVTSPALMGGLIGSQPTGNIPGRGSTILEFQWYPPNPEDYRSFGADRTHFCLLARIETSNTPPFGMMTLEGPNLYDNVRNNNNIVWKNITVAGGSNGGGIAGVTVNGLSKASSSTFVFSTSKEEPASIFDFGTIRVHLGEKLFEKWKEGGSLGKGIEANEKYEILILTSGAWIGNIQLEPEEFHTIFVQFEPNEEKSEQTFVLPLDLTQYSYYKENQKTEIAGGQRFVFKNMAEPKYKRGEEPTEIFDGVEWVPKEQ
jgi:hypothetical protein